MIASWKPTYLSLYIYMGQRYLVMNTWRHKCDSLPIVSIPNLGSSVAVRLHSLSLWLLVSWINPLSTVCCSLLKTVLFGRGYVSLTWGVIWYKQSGRSPKVVVLFLLQTLVAIKYDYFNCMIQSKRNQFLLPNLVAFISQNEKNVWFFDYHLFTCSVRKMVLICLMQNIDVFVASISSNRTRGITPH